MLVRRPRPREIRGTKPPLAPKIRSELVIIEHAVHRRAELRGVVGMRDEQSIALRNLGQ